MNSSKNEVEKKSLDSHTNLESSKLEKQEKISNSQTTNAKKENYGYNDVKSNSFNQIKSENNLGNSKQSNVSHNNQNSAQSENDSVNNVRSDISNNSQNNAQKENEFTNNGQNDTSYDYDNSAQSENNPVNSDQNNVPKTINNQSGNNEVKGNNNNPKKPNELEKKVGEKAGEKAGQVAGAIIGGPLGSKLGKIIGKAIGKNLNTQNLLKGALNNQRLPFTNNNLPEANENNNAGDLNDNQNSEGQNDENNSSKNDNNQNNNIKSKIIGGKGKSKSNIFVSGLMQIAGFITGIFGGYIIILLLIIIIVGFIMVGQSSKTLNVDEKGNIICMNFTSCSTVIIPEGPSAGTYTIDEYIAGAVNYYFGTYNNAEVYKAMGIVVNSDLIYYSDMDFTNDTCTLNEKTKFNNISMVSDSTADNNEEESNSEEASSESAISNMLITYGTLSSKAEIIIGYSSLIEPNENALNSASDYKTIIKEYLRVDELEIENFGVYKICNMSGSSNLAYVDMNVCNNVTVEGGKYPGTYTLDDYIAGVINNEVGGFQDTEIFKTFSVAARTYLFTRSQNNDGVCYISDSKNTQTFSPTTNQQIISAVAETSGQVMTDGNGNLISTEYDAFCYESKDGTNYYLAQKHQAIPISWAYENVTSYSNSSFLENPCGTPGGGGHGRGMSQLGAYYMSSIEGKKYDEILSFYYDTGTLSTTIKTDSITAEQNSYGLIYPLESTGNCTSQFGSRIHPITGVQKNHGGIDIARAANTPIYAAQDGVVAVNGYDSDGWGNYVKITGNNGLDTLYAHMIRPSTLQIGQTITAGTLIGYVGQTGAATGNHLHFEIYENGTRVDPLKYLPGLCG